MWSLVGGYFKQNYCHTCHTRFAVVFPFPPCRVSLLKTCRWHYSHPYAKQISCNVLWKQLWLFSLFCPKAKKFTKNFTLSNWWPWKMLKHKLLQVRRNWGEKYFYIGSNLQNSHFASIWWHNLQKLEELQNFARPSTLTLMEECKKIHQRPSASKTKCKNCKIYENNYANYKFSIYSK